MSLTYHRFLPIRALNNKIVPSWALGGKFLMLWSIGYAVYRKPKSYGKSGKGGVVSLRSPVACGGGGPVVPGWSLVGLGGVAVSRGCLVIELATGFRTLAYVCPRQACARLQLVVVACQYSSWGACALSEFRLPGAAEVDPRLVQLAVVEGKLGPGLR